MFADDVAAILDRALATNPNDVSSHATRGLVELDWKGDARPLHKAIESILKQNPDAIQEVADSLFICALAERDATAGERALVALGENTFGNDALQFPRSFGEGVIARMMNDPAKAQAAFTAARATQEKRVQAQPTMAPPCVFSV